MTDPFEIQARLDRRVVRLDELSKIQDQAVIDQGARTDAWEVILDEFTETLQGEYAAGEHKGAFPGQDRLVSMCRAASPENREAWRSLQRAELRLRKAANESTAVRAAIGGDQSLLKTLAAETAAGR